MNEHPESQLSKSSQKPAASQNGTKRTWSAPQVRDMGDVALQTKAGGPTPSSDGGFPTAS